MDAEEWHHWGSSPDHEQQSAAPRQDAKKAQRAAEVEKALAILESGQLLPPDPRQEGRPREDGPAFRARMDKLKDMYEAQYLKRSEWKVRCLCTGIASLHFAQAAGP
jgi:hypothetical protein